MAVTSSRARTQISGCMFNAGDKRAIDSADPSRSRPNFRQICNSIGGAHPDLLTDAIGGEKQQK